MSRLIVELPEYNTRIRFKKPIRVRCNNEWTTNRVSFATGWQIVKKEGRDITYFEAPTDTVWSVQPYMVKQTSQVIIRLAAYKKYNKQLDDQLSFEYKPEELVGEYEKV